MSDLLSSRQTVGVVGHPIQHSLSPLLHAAAFSALEIPWVSMAFDAQAGEGQAVVDACRTLRIRGLSVTMPLKMEIARAVDELDPSAGLLQSVNCLTMEGLNAVGASTDGQGFLDALKRVHGERIAGSHAVVVGSGGAARSVIAALGGAGAAEVSVVARNRQKGAEVAELAGGAGRLGDPTDAAVADIVIEATPLGMAGTPFEFEVPLVDPAILHEGQIVVDLVYEPFETAWLHEAHRQGAETLGGLGMLVHQAALQIERWTQQSAPLEAMWTAAEKALGR